MDIPKNPHAVIRARVRYGATPDERVLHRVDHYDHLPWITVPSDQCGLGGPPSWYADPDIVEVLEVLYAGEFPSAIATSAE